MSLKPLADRVLIKPVGAGKMNDKGERMPLDVHEGDVVIYGKFGGNEIKVDGEDYLRTRVARRGLAPSAEPQFGACP